MRGVTGFKKIFRCFIPRPPSDAQMSGQGSESRSTISGLRLFGKLDAPSTRRCSKQISAWSSRTAASRCRQSPASRISAVDWYSQPRLPTWIRSMLSSGPSAFEAGGMRETLAVFADTHPNQEGLAADLCAGQAQHPFQPCAGRTRHQLPRRSTDWFQFRA